MHNHFSVTKVKKFYEPFPYAPAGDANKRK